jgi:hypothetical protein
MYKECIVLRQDETGQLDGPSRPIPPRMRGHDPDDAEYRRSSAPRSIKLLSLVACVIERTSGADTPAWFGKNYPSEIRTRHRRYDIVCATGTFYC